MDETVPLRSYVLANERVVELLDEVNRLRKQETACRDLHHAYLRLRRMIPGAFNTPYAPTPEQVWEITENALRTALKDTAPKHYDDGRNMSESEW